MNEATKEPILSENDKIQARIKKFNKENNSEEKSETEIEE